MAYGGGRGGVGWRYFFMWSGVHSRVGLGSAPFAVFYRVCEHQVDTRDFILSIVVVLKLDVSIVARRILLGARHMNAG